MPIETMYKYKCQCFRWTRNHWTVNSTDWGKIINFIYFYMIWSCNMRNANTWHSHIIFAGVFWLPLWNIIICIKIDVEIHISSTTPFSAAFNSGLFERLNKFHLKQNSMHCAISLWTVNSGDKLNFYSIFASQFNRNVHIQMA